MANFNEYIISSHYHMANYYKLIRNGQIYSIYRIQEKNTPICVGSAYNYRSMFKGFSRDLHAHIMKVIKVVGRRWLIHLKQVTKTLGCLL